MPEDGEKDNGDWNMITGNGKTKNLLNPKPNPKVHHAFAILSQPGTPHPLQHALPDTTNQ
jgi:hypothetical protein